jgi:uncharacterized protein
VHDSFNFFMHTGVSQDVHPFIAENTAREGDYVELLALMDVLAVPNVCGADVMKTSDFELKPLKLTVFEGTAADWRNNPDFPKLRNQRSPVDFKVKNIKADRELYRDESYRPDFVNVPLVISELEVELSPSEMDSLEQLKANAKYGETDAEVLRYVVFTWWISNFMRGPKHASP